MSEEVSLYDLLNLSIGTPQKSSVNFGALHSLLLAMLKQLNLREVKTRWRDSSPGYWSPDLTAAEQEVQVEVQPDTDFQNRAATPSCPGPVPDQLNLLSRIQTCEDGLSKSTRLILDLNEQNERLKEQMEELRQQHEMVGDALRTAARVESCCHRVDALEETVKSLRDAVLPGDREGETEKFQKDPGDSGVDNQLVAAKQTSLPSGSDLTEPPQSSTPPSSHPDKVTVGPAAPSSPNKSECSSVQSGPPPQAGVKADSAGKPPASDSNSSTPSTEAVEALRSVSQLQERLVQVEAHVAVLEKGKADQSQLAQLRELIATKGSHGDAFSNLMDQLNEQRGLIDRLMSDRGKNVELVNGVQQAMLQLQADCKKLNETMRSLHEDSRRKQRHIEELYKTTEELEVNKADKEMVESEIRADKSALEGKVSRLQLDSVTEQLSGMFHELLNKVTSQEQDWHKLMGKLSTEMECKLNRIELDSVKKQLEDRWRSIHEKLQAQAAPEYEDAAGIRKQLVERFHCLSCDRPIVKHTPGPHLVTLPSFPAFPSHKSIRPFTVYTMEQLRQHYRSQQPGTNRCRYEAAKACRSRERLQRSRVTACRQIESVEMQGRPQHGDGTNTAQGQHERISELTDYGHLAAARSCGGSHHTNAAGSQRRGGPQYTKLHGEVDGAIQSEEVDIVGLDGRIYKGRLNVPACRNSETKLPTIPTRDGVYKSKDKAKPAASPEVGHSTPLHPPCSPRSAACSRSASSCSGRDWPVSALGCASQSSIAQGSAAADSTAEPPSNEPLNL
ncbi:glutamine-rich protein 2 isoform X5 [Simochromis diagramma]|uniref:glutamine-rich protein 2 isoform X5 n=1 Tax=Simochromis diagramma TaxID=43689 RepID=UPI001A7EF90C|nr:glutamine-rich protein 2 isoform X5 [Simochromis diagramma]